MDILFSLSRQIKFFLILSSVIYSQVVTFDISQNEQQSIINAISGLGQYDDLIGKADPPIISADINNNGVLDYISAMSAANMLYIFFDQFDFTKDIYYPHEGPNLIIKGEAGFGNSFTTGDFNGDGIDDLLIGDWLAGGDGEAYVIYGNESIPKTGTINYASLSHSKLSFIKGGGNRGFFGFQVCSPDLDNDGYDDIVVSAPTDWTVSGPGAIYIIYGKPNLSDNIQTNTEADIVIMGNGDFDHIGRYLRKGDYNGDNFDDLAFTSAHWPGAGYNGERGKAWILFGNNSLPDSFNVGQYYNQLTSFAGKKQNDWMAFVNTGDVNGDNIDDLILSSYKNDAPIVFPTSNNFGKIYINYGPIPLGQNFDDVESYSNQTQIYPNNINIGFDSTFMYLDSGFGQSIATQDINGDGFDDLLIGVPNYSRWPSPGYRSSEGAAFIIFGSNNLGKVIYNDHQKVHFYANRESSDYIKNQNFGRAVNFINTNNKVLAAICDVEKSMIYLFNIGEKIPITSINTNNILLNNYKINQNYPNPFNPSTIISYSIPITSRVTLKVYDVLGKEVLDLVNANQAAGNYKITVNASELTSGLYFYRLQANEYVETKKMILLK